jgi:hypothetical protein
VISWLEGVGDSARRPDPGPGVADHPPGGAQQQQRQDPGHRQVRPAGIGEPDPARRDEHGQVGGDVVAGALPDGTHVHVLVAMPPEQEQAQPVGGQADQAEHAHDLEQGNPRHDQPVDDLPDHHAGPQEDERALEQRHPGLHHGAPGHRVQAEAIGEGIAQVVQAVGQQRGGIAMERGRRDDEEHRRVDGQHRAQGAALAFAQAVDGTVGVAGAGHGGIVSPDDTAAVAVKPGQGGRGELCFPGRHASRIRSLPLPQR